MNGWADFRLIISRYEKWWEIVYSAYLLVSIADLKKASENLPSIPGSRVRELEEHPAWDEELAGRTG